MFAQTKKGDRVSFDIDTTADLERKTQTEMYSQPKLSKWGIFCPESKKDVC